MLAFILGIVDFFGTQTCINQLSNVQHLLCFGHAFNADFHM
jgi:hypothetical protein